MRRWGLLVFGLFFWLATALPAFADDVPTLRFAIPGSPPGTPTWDLMWQPWIDKVNKDADGTLKIQAFPGAALANLFNMYDRVTSGAVDMGILSQGAIGGKFPASSVVELPSTIGGREGAAAFWKIFQDGLVSAEYGEVHVAVLYVFPQSFLNASKPIPRLADVKGLKIVTLTKADAGAAQMLGAAPISSNPADVYSILQRHGADGVIIGWLGLDGFKLAEVTNNHLVAGLGSGGGAIIINTDSYAKLPGKAKAAIDMNSGYAASRDDFGAAIDKIYAGSEAAVRKLPGHTIATLDARDEDAYQKGLVQPLVGEWQKNIPNGPAIFADYRAEAAKVQAQK